MIVRRLQRSTRTPATGARKTFGRTPTSVAVASTVAEPVVSVSHQTSANCTSWVPNSDSAWPVQNVKKVRAQFVDDAVMPWGCSSPIFRSGFESRRRHVAD